MKNILMADDNVENLELLACLLQDHTLYIAQNGQEAIDLVKTHSDIELVLMDLHMPVMDGFAAIKQIRAYKPEIPILVLSASVLRADMDRCIDIGADGYLHKPFTLKDLSYKIWDIIDQYSEEKIFNKAEFKKDCENDLILMKTIIDSFKKAFKRFKDTVSLNNITSLDDLKNWAHQLKSTAGFAKSQTIYKYCKMLESFTELNLNEIEKILKIMDVHFQIFEDRSKILQ